MNAILGVIYSLECNQKPLDHLWLRSMRNITSKWFGNYYNAIFNANCAVLTMIVTRIKTNSSRCRVCAEVN